MNNIQVDGGAEGGRIKDGCERVKETRIEREGEREAEMWYCRRR